MPKLLDVRFGVVCTVAEVVKMSTEVVCLERLSSFITADSHAAV